MCIRVKHHLPSCPCQSQYDFFDRFIFHGVASLSEYHSKYQGRRGNERRLRDAGHPLQWGNHWTLNEMVTFTSSAVKCSKTCIKLPNAWLLLSTSFLSTEPVSDIGRFLAFSCLLLVFLESMLSNKDYLVISTGTTIAKAPQCKSFLRYRILGLSERKGQKGHLASKTFLL